MLLLHLFLTIAIHPIRTYGTIAALAFALVAVGFLLGRSRRRHQP